MDECGIVVDNFDLIRSMLKFNNENEFYFIQLRQRKKDRNEGTNMKNGYRLVRSYYVYSLADFDRVKPSIIKLCRDNNARAYINLNVRNAREVSLECIKKYAELVDNNTAFTGHSVWDSCCGSTRARGYKPLFLVDVDDVTIKDKIIELINKCRGAEEDKIKYEIPTVNGVHLITSGFDLHYFQQLLVVERLPHIDVHKNNPTLLYYERRPTCESTSSQE